MIVKNLSKSFNSNKILDNISFVLEDNDKVCLIGIMAQVKVHY